MDAAMNTACTVHPQGIPSPATALHNMPPFAASREVCHTIVLLTEDEAGCQPLIEALAQEDFVVRCGRKTADLLGLPARETELLILDSGRFTLEELSAFPRIRSVYTGLLMVLIDHIDEMLQVLLYEQGVDDLLLKPVNHLLMAARIRALLRRSQLRATPAHLLFNGLEINLGLRRVAYMGEEIPLTSREFDLFWHLAKHACITLDRDHLYRAVFGIEYNGYDRSIDMYIARIRAKMAKFPGLDTLIKTVRGTGYLFAAEQ